MVVIGAGVVGLAVAAKLSENNEDVYIFEKNERFGQETSSHGPEKNTFNAINVLHIFFRGKEILILKESS